MTLHWPREAVDFGIWRSNDDDAQREAHLNRKYSTPRTVRCLVKLVFMAVAVLPRVAIALYKEVA